MFWDCDNARDFMEDETIMSNDNTIHFEQTVVHPHLIVLYPQSQFAQIPLERGTVILGRGQDADIRFEDELISRRHCALSFDGGSVTVEDLGSTNGTFVDGNYVHRQILNSDNKLQIGKMVLKVAYKDPSEEAFSRELYEAATKDPLTGILNRQAFMDRSAGELVYARRNNSFIHVVMIDVDDFKHVNDTWGHQCGDLVLREVARLLNDETRDSELLARFGGEEFLVLMSGISPEDAKKRAEKLRSAIERHIFSWMDSVVPITISLGLSSRQGTDIAQISELIGESDKRLYTAKGNGKNQVAV